ncbi:hypothetical protein [Bacillus sp. V59.32b]|uniref:hypothetical protein n=1 Tax=Bacillus sp. V59.32b TaxID=1758642 RepID=UPI000E3BB748|nr:hypothetical protein [Bacillus sp. V59.32b]RFU64346.1 hypothetical protein D0463_10355 [Bacillus sp. V59.32b]
MKKEFAKFVTVAVVSAITITSITPLSTAFAAEKERNKIETVSKKQKQADFDVLNEYVKNYEKQNQDSDMSDLDTTRNFLQEGANDPWLNTQLDLPLNRSKVKCKPWE